VSEILDEKFESHLHEIDRKKDQSPNDKDADLFVRDIIVEHRARDHRIKKIAERERKRTQKVKRKELSVGLVILKKSLNHFCLLY
jgi:hypothetical protein